MPVPDVSSTVLWTASVRVSPPSLVVPLVTSIQPDPHADDPTQLVVTVKRSNRTRPESAPSPELTETVMTSLGRKLWAVSSEVASVVTTVTSFASPQVPAVRLFCHQGTTQVLCAQAGYYEGYLWPDYRVMPLYSMAWTGGVATCDAELFYWDLQGKKLVDRVISSLDFAVGP